jgi:hypothetical protein
MSRLEEYLSQEDVPLLMKMNQLVQNGPTGDFLDLWKIIRVCIWRRLQNGNGLNDQERAVREKLRKMARYKRQQMRLQSGN